tara:strand:- start:193 stop:366 length:174 start_codon:yes stop_codon:yes gene_type:complete
MPSNKIKDYRDIFFLAMELDEYQRKMLIMVLTSSMLTELSNKDVRTFIEFLEEARTH